VNPGDVIFWRQFEFPDGQRSDKLFIIANRPRDGVHLGFIVTSQQKRGRTQEDGCRHVDRWYFVRPRSTCFQSPTWVLFDDAYEFLLDELTGLRADGSIRLISGKVQSLVLNAIVSCFQLTDSVTDYHRALLR